MSDHCHPSITFGFSGCSVIRSVPISERERGVFVLSKAKLQTCQTTASSSIRLKTSHIQPHTSGGLFSIVVSASPPFLSQCHYGVTRCSSSRSQIAVADAGGIRTLSNLFRFVLLTSFSFFGATQAQLVCPPGSSSLSEN
jgi:hypothetical protein